MTKSNITSSNYINYTTFGGVIYDFDGYVSMASMAERIISDWKFDERCRKLATNRKRSK